MYKKIISLGLIAMIALNLSACSSNASNTNIARETTERPKLDWSHCYDDEEHKMMYVWILQKGVDNYIAGVKWPWKYDNYSFIDYDNTKSGIIVGSVKVEIRNLIEKKDVFVIFTITEDERYIINSVVVGDKIYSDDGKLAHIVNMFK